MNGSVNESKMTAYLQIEITLAISTLVITMVKL